MKLDRNKSKIKSLAESQNDDFVNLSPVERILLVWPLTEEIWIFKGDPIAQRRLQRNVAVVIRSQG